MEEEVSYEQCFNLRVEESEIISGKSVQSKQGNVVTENVTPDSGTAPYSISKNGKQILTTHSRKFSIEVEH